MERKEKGYLASEVEEKLGITATERKRWLNEGKIHYNGNQEHFHTRYGWKYVDLYDDEEIDKITTEEIENELRAAMEQEQQRRQREEARKEEERVREEKLHETERILEEINREEKQ